MYYLSRSQQTSARGKQDSLVRFTAAHGRRPHLATSHGQLKKSGGGIRRFFTYKSAATDLFIFVQMNT